MGILEKAYSLEDKIGEWFSRKFSGKYLRVLLYAQKPDGEELSHLTRVSLLGLLFVGFLGFAMYLLFYYAFHINLRFFLRSELSYFRYFLSSIAVFGMLKDPYGRPLLSMRVSLTMKCNYSCFFCHMEGGNGREREISPEDWKRIFEAARKLGIKEVKFTGGEPLLYEGLSEVLKYARENFSDLSLTTNGYLLEENVEVLKRYGVRINVSLHSLERKKYISITGSDGLDKVMRGLEKARGNLDVKINFLALRGYNEEEIWKILDYCKKMGFKLQLIEYEALLGKGDYYLPLREIERELERRSLAVKVRRQHGKKVYYMPNEVEVLRTWRNPEMCKNCTRIRVLPNGDAIPCIYRANERINLIEDPFEGIIKVNSIRRPYWR